MEAKETKKEPVTATVKNAFEGFAVLEFDQAPTFKAGDVVLIADGDAKLGKWKIAQY